jgi:ClpP class serine protease
VVKRLKKVGTSQAAALAVVVNSPGGLPVQSQIIGEKLQDFARRHNLKLYTFARDVAASGGYMVLSAGDHVVADKSSIVGSIGVVFQKLKLRGLLDRFAVDHKQFATNEYRPLTQQTPLQHPLALRGT